MIAHLPNNHVILAVPGREDLELQFLGCAGLESLSYGHLCANSVLCHRKIPIEEMKETLSVEFAEERRLRREFWWEGEEGDSESENDRD